MTPVNRKKTGLFLLNLQKKLRLSASFRASAVRAISALLKTEGHTSGGDINVCVMDDGMIRVMNRKYLGRDRPTDVISFNLQESGKGRIQAEIAVSAETAARSAAAYGNSAEKELLVYIIHGVLHALGYDDRTGRQRRVMQAKTDAVTGIVQSIKRSKIRRGFRAARS